MNFLTAWGCEINKADKEGSYTPLHLAVISSNVKIVRRLLQKGADRNIIDKNFKKPIDIAKENDFHNIYAMLEEKNRSCELFEVKNSNKPKKRSKNGVLLYFLFIILIHLITLVLYFPCKCFVFLNLLSGKIRY